MSTTFFMNHCRKCRLQFSIGWFWRWTSTAAFFITPNFTNRKVFELNINYITCFHQMPEASVCLSVRPSVRPSVSLSLCPFYYGLSVFFITVFLCLFLLFIHFLWLTSFQTWAILQKESISQNRSKIVKTPQENTKMLNLRNRNRGKRERERVYVWVCERKVRVSDSCGCIRQKREM